MTYEHVEGRPPPRMELMEVTPEQAARWLEAKAPNRSIHRDYARQYCADMSASRWLITGEAIKFDWDGNLIDGQHRLQAIVDSGASIMTFVCYGLAPFVFDVLDSGKSRSFADLLQAKGVSAPTKLAPLARLLFVYDKTGDFGPAAYGRQSNLELRPVVARYGEDVLIAANSAGKAMRREIGHSEAVWGVLWLVFGELSLPDRDYFFDRLRIGDHLEKGQPLFALRRLLTDRVSLKKTGSIRPRQLGGYAIKAWNKHRLRESAQNIMFRQDEDFPTPI